MGGTLSYPILTEHVERAGNTHVKVAVSSAQGYRMEMEDACTINFNFCEASSDVMLFGVFDGHGGGAASKYLQENLSHYLSTLPDPFDEEAITQAVLALDAAFLKTPNADHGSTACFVLSSPNPDGTLRIKVCNVGDSRAMIVRQDGSFVELSRDHKPTLPDERQRIINAFGEVRGARVDGNLAVSRAVGDRMYKRSEQLSADKQKVISVPEFQDYTAQPGELLLVCCDGIYEQMKWSEVAAVVHNRVFGPKEPDDEKANETPATMDLAPVLSELIYTSLDKGSQDNHTAMIIQISDGTEYIQKYAAKQLYPGPYHRFADDTTFAKAYQSDLEANGYTLEEAMPQIIQMEESRGLPTTTPPPQRTNAAAANNDIAFLQNFMKFVSADFEKDDTQG